MQAFGEVVAQRSSSPEPEQARTAAGGDRPVQAVSAGRQRRTLAPSSLSSRAICSSQRAASGALVDLDAKGRRRRMPVAARRVSTTTRPTSFRNASLTSGLSARQPVLSTEVHSQNASSTWIAGTPATWRAKSVIRVGLRCDPVAGCQRPEQRPPAAPRRRRPRGRPRAAGGAVEARPRRSPGCARRIAQRARTASASSAQSGTPVSIRAIGQRVVEQALRPEAALAAADRGPAPPSAGGRPRGPGRCGGRRRGRPRGSAAGASPPPGRRGSGRRGPFRR